MKRQVFFQMTATLLACFPMLVFAQAPSSFGPHSDLIPRHLLGLVHAPEVHQELKLTTAQVTQLEELFAKIDGDWFRARNLPADKQAEVIAKLEAGIKQWLKRQLSSAQYNRLQQLEYRAQGTRMLLRQDLAKKIGLDSGQQYKLAELAKATDDVTKQLQQATMQNKATDEKKNAVLKANTAEQDALKSVMRAEQLQKLAEQLGEPFDTASLKRIYPMAPELVSVEHWINSDPMSLKELRGKVVLLHFYAFQCHNCHANFGHYKKWHEKYGDDVVVLGIQRPETSAERDPAAVKKAAIDKQLEFPIMVDLESKNWDAWSNTMWPTVYVIDKNGYIRQWWQGELNWQGATGDATIEKTVDELLAEQVGV